MQRRIPAGAALAAALLLGCGTAWAGGAERPPTGLSTETGSFTFGYISDGKDTDGPFLIDTASGRVFRYEKLKKEGWVLVPVRFYRPEPAAPAGEGEDEG